MGCVNLSETKVSPEAFNSKRQRPVLSVIPEESSLAMSSTRSVEGSPRNKEAYDEMALDTK